MTTFKGWVRSTNATINRMEKAHQRRVREAVKVEKLRQKGEMLANAAQTVERYNELIAILTSVHKEASEPLNWQEILEEPAPTAPIRSDRNEQEAMQKLQHYKPSFFDKLFRMTNSKKRKLEANLIAARDHDVSHFEKATQAYDKDLEEWGKMHQMATGILKRDNSAYKDAIQYFDPFSGIAGLGSEINFTFHTDHVQAGLVVRAEDALPKQILSLTSTGKLSQKDMPVSRFHDLYQDHVCSSLLRVARETIALLPIDFVIVNVLCDLLNSSTGRMEQQTIISAAVFPETLFKLNFDKLDPSDSLKNFKHEKDFSKAAGFKPVKQLIGNELSNTTNSPGGQPEVVRPIPVHSTSEKPNSQRPHSLDQEILQVYQQKGLLHAVKLYKDKTGADLTVSKNYVENLAASKGIKKSTSSGCAGVILVFLIVILIYCLA